MFTSSHFQASFLWRMQHFSCHFVFILILWLSFHQLYFFIFLHSFFSLCPSVALSCVVLSLLCVCLVVSCSLAPPALAPSFPSLLPPCSRCFSKPTSYGRRLQRSWEDVRPLHRHRRTQELRRQRGHLEDVPPLQRFPRLPHAHHGAGERTSGVTDQGRLFDCLDVMQILFFNYVLLFLVCIFYILHYFFLLYNSKNVLKKCICITWKTSITNHPDV